MTISLSPSSLRCVLLRRDDPAAGAPVSEPGVQWPARIARVSRKLGFTLIELMIVLAIRSKSTRLNSSHALTSRMPSSA